MEYSVVIPAYNEAKRIGATLRSVCKWLSEHRGSDWEVIVVNNGSTDGTAHVVRHLTKTWHAIRLIDESCPGKGCAVATGMKFATGRIRLFTDADNSTTIDHLEKMEPYLSQGYDVVIASIAVPGAHIARGGEEPFWRVVLGKLGNLWIQALAVPGIRDTQRGFKVFSARAANDIFGRLTIVGWGFDVEVLAVARARGYRIKEVPIRWKNAPDSKVNIWAYPKVLMETAHVGLNRLRGIYKHGERI